MSLTLDSACLGQQETRDSPITFASLLGDHSADNCHSLMEGRQEVGIKQADRRSKPRGKLKLNLESSSPSGAVFILFTYRRTDQLDYNM